MYLGEVGFVFVLEVSDLLEYALLVVAYQCHVAIKINTVVHNTVFAGIIQYKHDAYEHDGDENQQADAVSGHPSLECS